MIGLVDGNNFFVSCERVFNRRLVGRPVAVLSNNDGCCVARSNRSQEGQTLLYMLCCICCACVHARMSFPLRNSM